jgi:hypothetical protein
MIWCRWAKTALNGEKVPRHDLNRAESQISLTGLHLRMYSVWDRVENEGHPLNNHSLI